MRGQAARSRQAARRARRSANEPRPRQAGKAAAQAQGYRLVRWQEHKTDPAQQQHLPPLPQRLGSAGVGSSQRPQQAPQTPSPTGFASDRPAAPRLLCGCVVSAYGEARAGSGRRPHTPAPPPRLGAAGDRPALGRLPCSCAPLACWAARAEPRWSSTSPSAPPPQWPHGPDPGPGGRAATSAAARGGGPRRLTVWEPAAHACAPRASALVRLEHVRTR